MKILKNSALRSEVRPCLWVLSIFFLSGCGLFPGKSPQEEKLSALPVSWEQLCFSPQGRARVTQGTEKNLASVEGLFRPEEKQWAVAFSAPIYGERVFRLHWADGKVELSSADLQALGWDQKQRSSVIELAKFMASLLQSSIDKSCKLSNQGECPAPIAGLPAFQYKQTEQGVEFSYETQRAQKIIWLHRVVAGTDGGANEQSISFYGNNSGSIPPEWSLELFLSRCGENEPVQNT